MMGPARSVWSIWFVSFISLVWFNQMNKIGWWHFFSSLLRKEIGRVSSGGFVEMECTAALLFRLIHSHVGMLQ